jgi:hypothetical protein
MKLSPFARGYIRGWLIGKAVGLLILGAVLLATGCATAGPGPSMGCVDPFASDCKDPSAYPSLRAQLPKSPFPFLFKPLPERTP